VIRRAAIAFTTLALAACTMADSPLRRDLEQLSQLPEQLDQALKAQHAPPAPQTAEVAPPTPNVANVQTATAQPAPVAPAPLAPPPEQFYSPISKPVVVENPLARPPWEAFAEAGPNANDELDLDTLYGQGNIPPELAAKEDPDAAAAMPAPEPPPEKVAETSAPESAPANTAAKPGATTIRAVAVPSVTGARGKGNAELTQAMRTALKQAGWPVLNAPRKDALTIRGHVSLSAMGGQDSVHLVWDVLTPDGKALGNLKQDNSVPTGSLNASWGASAKDAADAAAEGIFGLIQKYRG
jgi:hypothetical protein